MGSRIRRVEPRETESKADHAAKISIMLITPASTRNPSGQRLIPECWSLPVLKERQETGI